MLNARKNVVPLTRNQYNSVILPRNNHNQPNSSELQKRALWLVDTMMVFFKLRITH